MLTEKPRIPIRDILIYGFWPSVIKIFLYRLKGYRIGKGVSIGLGSVICGKQVEIGDHTAIGFLTIIRGEEIHLESHVRIGAMTFLDTPHLQVGEGTNFNEQVFVGGLQCPDSRLVVGRNCSIMQMSFINPAKSIVIGDDCVIGGHCLIFGHSSSLNQLEGYPVEFAPIEIGQGVGLAWRTFVLPGAKIGDGTMVGANSVVSGTLPSHSMAVGYPARIVGRPPVFPKPVSNQEKVEMFRKIVAEMIDFWAASGLECKSIGADRHEICQHQGRWRGIRRWKMQVVDSEVGYALKSTEYQRVDVFLSLQEIPDDVRAFLSSHNVMWLDVATKEQSRRSNDLGTEVAHYFRRFGVRMSRYPRTVLAPQPQGDLQG